MLFWNFGISITVIVEKTHKVWTSFKTLASKKASTWRLKKPQQYDKQCKVISSHYRRNKMHLSKQIVPRTNTLEKRAFAATFKGLLGRLFRHSKKATFGILWSV